MNKIQCPNCLTDKFLKEISYGMPSSEFDFDKFHVGGCIPSDSNVHCSQCDWEDGTESIENPEAF